MADTTYLPSGSHYIIGRDFNKFMSKLDRGIKLGIRRVSNRVYDDIQADMRRPKHGAYFGERTRRSAPGESPAVQMGELARSIFNTVPNRVQKHWIERMIGTNLKFGLELEIGRPVRQGEFGPMKPRPWLGPAAASIKGRELYSAIKMFTRKV